MTELSGRAGGVYTGESIISACETQWDSEQGLDVTCTADGDYYKVGSKSAKMAVIESVGGALLIATEDVTASLVDYDVIQMWLRSSLALNADDWNFYLSETEDCPPTPDVVLSIPALAQNTWTRVCWDLGDTSTLDAIISIGVYQKADKLALDFYVDDVSTLALVDGIKSWTIDYTLDTLDTTDFGDGAATNAARTFIAGLSGWSGSFEGYKDSAPDALSFGSAVTLILTESKTAGQSWIGDAYITGVHPSVSVDGLVIYTYDFQGTGELTEAVA